QTVGKLSSAAGYLNVLTPISEIEGGLLSHLPGIRRIAEKAPREGGFNPRAEAAALMTLFNKVSFGPETKTTEAARRTLTTGKTKLDVLYGNKKVSLDPEWTEFFGRIHGALKTQPKIAEFQRSFVKRTEFEYR